MRKICRETYSVCPNFIKLTENIMMNRRSFINKTALGTAILTVPWLSSCQMVETVNIGLIADVHKDVMHDANGRLQAFLQAAEQRKHDFLIQMGDFCTPKVSNDEFMGIWNNFPGEKHHLIGNHEVDGGFSREDVVKYFNMPSKYYSFDKKGIHFVLLDGNDPNPGDWSGYHRYIGDEQLQWLRDDLGNTSLPVIVFSHQTLENEQGGVANFKEVRSVLEESNEASGGKIIACLSGHHHTDYHTSINGIYYIQINSASYRWVGGDWLNVRYSEEIDETHPWIKYTIPYKDSLFAFMEISPEGYIKLEGKVSEFVGPGPEEMNMPERPENDIITPRISSFEVKV